MVNSGGGNGEHNVRYLPEKPRHAAEEPIRESTCVAAERRQNPCLAAFHKRGMVDVSATRPSRAHRTSANLRWEKMRVNMSFAILCRSNFLTRRALPAAPRDAVCRRPAGKPDRWRTASHSARPAARLCRRRRFAKNNPNAVSGSRFLGRFVRKGESLAVWHTVCLMTNFAVFEALAAHDRAKELGKMAEQYPIYPQANPRTGRGVTKHGCP